MTAMKRRAFLLGVTGTAGAAILAACGGEEIAATATRVAPTVNSAAGTVSSAGATVASTVAATTAPTAAAATTAPTSAATTAPTAAATASTAATAAATVAPTAASTAAPAATAAPATSGSAPAGTVVAADGIRAEATPVISGMANSTAIPMLQGRISVPNVRIAFVPGDDPSTFFMKNNDLFAYMKQSLGKEVTGTVGANYTAVITAMGAKRIELASYGPFSYILAKVQTNCDCLLIGETADGKLATYNSLIIAPVDSPINTLADLKGKNISFVDAASTSGHLVPSFTILQKAGLKEMVDYKFIYAGNHPASYEAVANKKVDAGAIASDIYEQGVADGKIDPKKVKVIDKSFDIPGSPVAVRGDLPQADKDTFLQMFLAINNRPKDDPLYQSFVVKGGFGVGTVKLRKGDDSVYNDLRKVPEAIGVDIKTLK